ncbi:MAG: membrane dipeptidase [Pseudomonadota bacterium]|nr:membrane dipeptidase [Pseudomonadota bacterium]
MPFKGLALTLAILFILLGCSQENKQEASLQISHEDFLVLDAHLDTPIVLDRPGFDISSRHDPMHDYAQIDLPRMREGGLDGGFWVIYTPQGDLTPQGYEDALAHAWHRNSVIDEMLIDYADNFMPATTADDAAAIVAQGKHVVYKSIENAYPLGLDVTQLDAFYEAGVRMVGLVHMTNNQFADSSTDPDGLKWNGLSQLGEDLIRRANALGMIIDMSHAHDLALAQAIDLSTTPIILSHSGAGHLYEHPRNVGDALLLDLAASGGVMHINSLSAYLKDLETDPARRPALSELFKQLQENPLKTEADTETFLEARRAIDKKYPPDFANFYDVMRHIYHAHALMGAAHIGIGLDWDGGGGVDDLQDITGLPKITQAMREAGLSDEDIAALWSGNLLRVLRLVEASRVLSYEMP